MNTIMVLKAGSEKRLFALYVNGELKKVYQDSPEKYKDLVLGAVNNPIYIDNKEYKRLVKFYG